ncbi:MAG: FkbM family methyltransferase [Elusimicrobia bacterium]|nr:FkbM family methyltransferase [Elusimicrobiota bacterium]
MNLDELRRAYGRSAISKPDYIEAMYRHHGILHEYARFLKDTDISSIEITDGRVLMTVRDTGLRLVCAQGDRRLAPLEMLNFGTYEREYIEACLMLLDQEATVFDVGANIGWYALTLARRKPDIRVFSFEPIAGTYKDLQENVRINGASNVRCLDFGLGEKEATQTFYFYPEGSANASAANLSGREGVRELACRVRRLDDFTREERLRVDFIKCDVEGAELFVLRGGRETIGRDRPVIFSEMLRKWAAQFEYHPNDIIALLAELGYRCFRLDEGRLSECPKVDESTVDTNFFFLHPAQHAAKLRLLAR